MRSLVQCAAHRRARDHQRARGGARTAGRSALRSQDVFVDRGSKIAGWMGTGNRESVHHAGEPYSHVPLFIMPLGCTGSFFKIYCVPSAGAEHPL